MATPTRYMEGIEEAEKRGCVVQHGAICEWGEDYGHLHQQGLSLFNSRYLIKLAARILSTRQEIKTILEFGPGSGTGTSQMSHLAPQAKITTAFGLQPVNPYLRFVKDLFGEGCLAQHTSLSGSVEDLIRRKSSVLDGRKSEPYGGSCRMDAMLFLQREFGIEIFEALDFDHPFIEKQYVGRYSDEIARELYGRFDFVYERQGPCHRHAEYDAFVQTERVYNAYKAMSPTGAMLIDGRGIEEILREKGAADVKTSLTNPENGFGTLVVKRDNPHCDELIELARAA
ncbi:MAG: hypothetical protein US89_C0005G0006 [Candidatus Peregrinibacteria bacterium GW2011_GWF2_38_29]|nr:MAG: hypothetical protein US89_C0005G0006 [Candidatus Peregrinibacteria bacterium GW2011_GWF2_38_29]